MSKNFFKMLIIIFFIHLSFVSIYVIIFEGLNSHKKQMEYLTNNIDNINNIILGDSTGVFGFKNSLLIDHKTVNLSMYAENIICSFYKLKYLKNKFQKEFNIIINAQDYIFNRNAFCINGDNVRSNIIKYEDYIDYFIVNNQNLDNLNIRLKYFTDFVFYNLYFDIYDKDNLNI